MKFSENKNSNNFNKKKKIKVIESKYFIYCSLLAILSIKLTIFGLSKK